MAEWCLLIIGHKSHLINLGLKIVEIKGFGNFPTNFLKEQEIGVEFELFDKKSKLLPYHLTDIQANLWRGPQIISPKDIAWLVYSSNLKSGDIVVEAGGGSGALTTALGQTIFPNGKVITFEKNSKHVEIIKKNLNMSPYSDIIELRNEELNDDIKPIVCNSIILDLPEPQKIINWAVKSLELGGKMLCYVPTINQVEKLLVSLDKWSQIEISESIHRTWQSRLSAIRPDTNLIGHTGFIVSARLLNK
ncbi:uncharacterized protein METZ01_LOCUS165411 [marine metagenome]|uniref:tRNA (adenine(58)-N(1))-methyltransferase catalytic subunit TRM61 C-terminal domain-containing protein n=1 Tax=marine metagenome TaxID=408172 RepID=A0A382BH94_9ZZZZ|tara:strand:- start:1440 stop:2183 length:744 start_codon:yes stop_codon:yes gene_type:complete